MARSENVRRVARRGLVLGAVAALAASVGWYVLGSPRQTDEIPAPSATAAPDEVVAAYLEALGAHDCATARAVMTAGSVSVAESWCGRLEHLAEIEVGTPRVENPRWLGFPADVPAEFVRVPVSFDLDWRPFRGHVSMPEGATSWGYFLVREDPDGPWRIFDQGCC